MFISPETVIQAVNKFKTAKWTDPRHKMEYFSLFLLLKRLGISVTDSVTNEDFLANSNKRELVMETLFMTTGLFDPTIKPLEQCSLDPFAFDTSGTNGNYKYFNKSSKWKALPTRIPDTIDNSGRDYYIDRTVIDGVRHFRLKQDYLHILSGKEFLDNRKIDVRVLSSWLYRFTSFEKIPIRRFPLYLTDLFVRDFNINPEEYRRLFTQSEFPIQLSEEFVSANEIKKQLPGLDPHFDKGKISITRNVKPNLTFRDYLQNKENEIMNESEVLNTLIEWKQAILVGPPGTGKSYLAKNVAKTENGGKKFFESAPIIQFHPSYSYEEFIGGIRWDPKDKAPKEKEGVLLSICQTAAVNPDKNFLLIIDEINRGNLSNIFGEAIMALDRNYSLKLKVDFQVKDGLFMIPNNLYILGTMNSNDRSLALIDYALRRRFAFIRVDFEKKVLDEFYAQAGHNGMIGEGLAAVNVITFAGELNQTIAKILGVEMTLGQTFFMAPNGKWTVNQFRKQFNYIILPTLEEYAFGKSEKLAEILKGLNHRFTDDNAFLTALKSYTERQ